MSANSVGIPIARVFEKFDALMAKKDFDAAERHLKYWLADAEVTGDRRGMLAVTNELIGFYRKTGKKSEALEASEKALALAKAQGLEDSITMGTTLINAATAYKAFGEAEKAVPLYEKAKDIYEKLLSPDDRRKGGLYNNMALALRDTGDLSGAEEMFKKALEIMSRPGDEAEAAITLCNMADLYGDKAQRDDCLKKAFRLLNSENLQHDGYHAFVCEKCAPTFAYYGFEEYEKVLSERAKRIYEGT